MRKLIICISTLIMTTGCVVQQKYWNDSAPIFMNETARPLISSIRVMVGLDYDSKMGPPMIANQNSAQQFGLIGLLVESAIVYNENDSIQMRQRRLTEINRATLEFNIGSQFREAVESTMKPIDWLNISYVVKKHDIKIHEIEKMVVDLEEDALLLIDNKYLMAEDFSKLEVLSYVAIYANEANLVKIAKDARPDEYPPTLYKNLFRFEYPYQGTYITADKAINGWSENGSQMLKNALSKSIENLVNQIVTDFSYTTISYQGNK